MVPDVEREWIAEECRTAPQPAWRLIVLLILMLWAVGALYLWLAQGS